MYLFIVICRVPLLWSCSLHVFQISVMLPVSSTMSEQRGHFSYDHIGLAFWSLELMCWPNRAWSAHFSPQKEWAYFEGKALNNTYSFFYSNIDGKAFCRGKEGGGGRNHSLLGRKPLVDFSQHIKSVGEECYFNRLYSSFFTSWFRASKTRPEAMQCCLLMPHYTMPATPQLQLSSLELLRMKTFSCVKAFHALGGSNAGGSVFPPLLNSAMRTNWPGDDELSISFKTKRIQINCSWALIVLLSSINNIMYLN